jgi:hypothetical protein
MNQFRFSPIKDREQLFKAIEYIHIQTHRLCKMKLGYYLPVAGNIGVFCHFDDEFERLTAMRKELTDENDNWNKKYYRLHQPIVIPAREDIIETTYTYLYVRRPDPTHPDVGDADFCMAPEKFKKLKNDLLSGKVMEGVEVFDRPELDLIKLSDPKVDVGSFVGWETMEENVKNEK